MTASPLLTLIDEPMQGGVQPLTMAAGCALLIVAAISASASAALLTYSGTKLQKLVGPEKGEARAGELQDADLELRVMTRLITLTAATGSVVVLSVSVSGMLGQIVFAALCLILLLLVAVLPAAAAQRSPERLVLRLLPVLLPMVRVLRYPLIQPMLWFSRPLMRAFRIDGSRGGDEIAEDILAAVADSAAGQLADEERTWISNIVELKELHASEVMTPRTDVHAVPTTLPLADAIELAVAKGHSRFPAYRASIDEVVGVFYAKDVLSRITDGQSIGSCTVQDLMRPPLFAPETMRVSDLLREFKTSKVQMAIVLDEYGGTAGLITIEDVLEEIVGDIEDEFDPHEEASIQVIESGRVIEVSGRTRVEEANDVLGTDRIPEGDDYDTVGGFIFDHLGHIPAVDECVTVDGLELRALAVDGRRIQRVRLSVLSAQPTDS